MTDLNETNACNLDEISEGLTDILFAPSHCFSALLKAFKDTEYQDSHLSEFADRIVHHMRFVGQTSANLPVVYGEIRAIDEETQKVLLEATFYWGQDEKAFFFTWIPTANGRFHSGTAG
tara:strand:+ start:543 stop:899 length:357 start_codon:yes stop_codon:yes gene_type:complete